MTNEARTADGEAARHRALARSLSGGTVGRRAAAGGSGPGDRPAAGGLAAGRAAVEPRRPGAASLAAGAEGPCSGSSACRRFTSPTTRRKPWPWATGSRCSTAADCSRSARPNEIYQRPANAFVAEFFGPQGMNMIEGELVRRAELKSAADCATVDRCSSAFRPGVHRLDTSRQLTEGDLFGEVTRLRKLRRMRFTCTCNSRSQRRPSSRLRLSAQRQSTRLNEESRSEFRS